MGYVNYSADKIGEWRYVKTLVDAKTVLTNGCFDLLHPGHLMKLRRAIDLGGYLVVSIDRDEDVRRSRGPGRPILPWQNRALLVAALPFVDAVTWHSREPYWNRLSAVGDCSLTALMTFLRPDVWAARSEALPEDEEATARKLGIKVVRLPRSGDWSSSAILERYLSGFCPKESRTP